MRTVWLMIVALSMGTGCATASAPAPAPEPGRTSQPRVPQPTPILRLLEITPGDGSQVDASTEIVARVAYHIPNFDPDRTYLISATFAGTDGRTFGRAAGHALIRTPVGIATIRQPLAPVWAGVPNQLATPLAGTFHLVERVLPPAPDHIVEGGQGVQIRTTAVVTPVLARTRTFYFNGAGPARTLTSSLPDILEEYWTYQPNKALAIAYDAPDRWTYGYAYGRSATTEAAEEALRACRTLAQQREIDAPCQLIAVNNDPPEAQAGTGEATERSSLLPTN